MSFLSDLLANARNTKLVKNSQQAIQNYETDRLSGSLGHEGSWGSKDRGYTELFTDIFKPGQSSADGGSDFFPNDTNTGIDAVATGDTYGPSLDEILASASPTGTTTSTPTSTPTGDDGTTALASALALARDQARIVAQQGYDRARGIYDEGKGMIKNKGQEFLGMFNQNSADIHRTNEGERGNLQASNQGANERLRNGLRALGLGGSAFERGAGRQRQSAAKASGELASIRGANDRTNLEGYNTNQNFLNTQDASLNRYLQDASNLRGSAETSGEISYLNDIGNLFNTIQANQNAINASTGNYSPVTTNTNIPSMLNALNLDTSNFSNPNANSNQATDLGLENLSYLEKLKRGLL